MKKIIMMIMIIMIITIIVIIVGETGRYFKTRRKEHLKRKIKKKLSITARE